jgi:predicted transcriptional regulator
MTANTLHIRVDRPQNARDHIQERLAGIEDGDEIEERSVLYLKSVADLHRVFSPKNMELLKVVLEQEPRSVREAARFVDREPSEVSKNLNELEQLGMIRFEQDGRAKQPVVWYTEFDVEISLPGIDLGTDPDSRALA